MFVNLLVATSNFMCLPMLGDLSKIERTHVILVMLSSILVNLSEIRHGLSGVYPFSTYTEYIVMINRIIFAFTMGFLFPPLIDNYLSKKMHVEDLIEIALGLFFLIVNGYSHSQVGYAASYIMWNFVLYNMMYRIFINVRN